MSVIETNDKGFAFTGNSYPSKNIFIYKTASDGTLQWSKSIGDTSGSNSSYAQTILQNSNKQYIIGGYTNSFGAGQYDFYLAKTDSLGNSYCNGLSLNPVINLSPFYDLLATKNTLGTASDLTFLVDTGGVENTICYNVEGISQYSNFNTNISIYPNPSSGSFQLSVTNELVSEIKIYDVAGKLVLSKSLMLALSKGEGVVAIVDASALNEGVYTISISGNEGTANKS